LPAGASSNQANVPDGYFRTTNGKLKRLLSQRTRPKVKRKVDVSNYAPVGRDTKLVPLGEEVIIQCDRYMDEATCSECRGCGHTNLVCTDCGGSKLWWVDASGVRDKRALADRSNMKQIACITCKASQAGDPIPRATGYTPCKPCGGTGQAGVGTTGVAASTALQQEPTTGVILATGPEVTRLNRGDRVLFSKYAGDEYIYDKRTYRIMHQRFPRAKVVGNADVRVQEARML
jgi:Chaperonin 10 Kd subunit